MNLDPSDRYVAAQSAMKDLGNRIAEQNWKKATAEADAIRALLYQVKIACERKIK